MLCPICKKSMRISTNSLECIKINHCIILGPKKTKIRINQYIFILDFKTNTTVIKSYFSNPTTFDYIILIDFDNIKQSILLAESIILLS